MSKKFKARGKVTQKFTRNGLIESNAATGEDIRVSKRLSDFNLRAENAESLTESPTLLQSATRLDAKTKKRKRGVINKQSQALHHTETDESAQAIQFTLSETAGTSNNESVENSSEQNSSRQMTEQSPNGGTPETPEVVLHDGHMPEFSPEHNSEIRKTADSSISVRPKENAVFQSPPPTAPSDMPRSQLHTERPDRLKFDHNAAEPDNGKEKHKPRPPDAAPVTIPKDGTAETTAETIKVSDILPRIKDANGESLWRDKTDSALNTETTNAPLRSTRTGKFQLQSDEVSKSVPTADITKTEPSAKVVKAQEKLDKAVSKLEKAKTKLPVKKKLRFGNKYNEGTDTAKRKLYFETSVKTQHEHLKGTKLLRPVKTLGNGTLAFGHRKIFKVERENVAVEAVHKGEMAVEGVTRKALRDRKLAPFRKAAKLQRKVTKKSINLTYQKTLAENPKLKSNPISRAFQKRKIKKDYAKAAREAKRNAERAKKAGSLVGKAGKALIGLIKRHPVAAANIVLILLVLFLLMTLISIFGSLGGGGVGGILQVSYLANDADIDNAELAYTEWETDLLMEIAGAETSHGGYDEYRYIVGDISHNPYELMAYLTVKYQDFTYSAIEADLHAIFYEQYSLDFTPSTETRYADADDADGDGDYEPYDLNVMTITLTAKSFSDVVSSHLAGEEAARYALLMQSKGGRQLLANPFGGINWLPYVSSYYGYRVHPIDGIKDYHKGVDIALPQGTEIHSGQDGTVTFAGTSGDYGNVVVIENADGLVSKYAHCDSISVSVGQEILIGDVIATVGNTGASTGAHLHLEVEKNGQALNPIYFADCGSYSSVPQYGDPGEPMGDGTYEAMMDVAMRFEGWRYVWGGSSPETSFDCSGLVSYIVNQSGAGSIGRTTANGIYNLCTPISPDEAEPGDLVFFHSTYSTVSPITHIGVYCGGNLMYDAGDPIGYTRIDTAYWQTHLFGFARLP